MGHTYAAVCIDSWKSLTFVPDFLEVEILDFDGYDKSCAKLTLVNTNAIVLLHNNAIVLLALEGNSIPCNKI